MWKFNVKFRNIHSNKTALRLVLVLRLAIVFLRPVPLATVLLVKFSNVNTRNAKLMLQYANYVSIILLFIECKWTQSTKNWIDIGCFNSYCPDLCNSLIYTAPTKLPHAILRILRLSWEALGDRLAKTKHRCFMIPELLVLLSHRILHNAVTYCNVAILNIHTCVTSEMVSIYPAWNLSRQLHLPALLEAAYIHHCNTVCDCFQTHYWSSEMKLPTPSQDWPESQTVDIWIFEYRSARILNYISITDCFRSR